ncbi:hypothetical protein ACHAP8_008020 [Fusarium lateritium]
MKHVKQDDNDHGVDMDDVFSEDSIDTYSVGPELVTISCTRTRAESMEQIGNLFNGLAADPGSGNAQARVESLGQLSQHPSPPYRFEAIALLLGIPQCFRGSET